jgi:hypothetical protein
VTKGKTKIPYDGYATSTPVFQLTTPTLKISLTKTKVSDSRRGSEGSLATGREPIPIDGPNYRITKGGFEEFNILVEQELEKGQTRSRLVYHMHDERTPKEQMPNIYAVYGNRDVKFITTGRIMVKNMKETRS